MNITKEHFYQGRPGPVVIAFYTDGTPYVDEARAFMAGLRPWCLTYKVYGCENLGSWQKNTQMKSKVVEHALLKDFPGQKLLYLDVDSIIVQMPDLSCPGADIGAVHFADTGEMLSGTVMFAGTDKCREAVRRWNVLNEAYPDKLPNGRDAWDQRTLKMAIADVGAVFYEFPQGYTWVSELTPSRYPGLSPVIAHTRGALRYRQIVDGKPFEQA